jgi:hypothetical protein
LENGSPEGDQKLKGWMLRRKSGRRPPGKVKKEITSKDRLRRTYGGRAELEENEEGSDRIWLH